MGKQDRWDEAQEPSAISAESTSSTSRDYPSRDYVQGYYVRPEIIGRLERLQDQWNEDNRSRLVCWLLEHALDLVDNGKLKPPMETRAKLD